MVTKMFIYRSIYKYVHWSMECNVKKERTAGITGLGHRAGSRTKFSKKALPFPEFSEDVEALPRGQFFGSWAAIWGLWPSLAAVLRPMPWSSLLRLL